MSRNFPLILFIVCPGTEIPFVYQMTPSFYTRVLNNLVPNSLCIDKLRVQVLTTFVCQLRDFFHEVSFLSRGAGPFQRYRTFPQGGLLTEPTRDCSPILKSPVSLSPVPVHPPSHLTLLPPFVPFRVLPTLQSLFFST